MSKEIPQSNSEPRDAQNSRQSPIAPRRDFIYKNRFGGIITLKKYIQNWDDLGCNKNLVFKSR